MLILFALLSLTAACLFIALKKKKIFYLLIPVMTMLAYFVVQIILVPAPLLDTIKFIFALR